MLLRSALPKHQNPSLPHGHSIFSNALVLMIVRREKFHFAGFFICELTPIAPFGDFVVLWQISNGRLFQCRTKRGWSPSRKSSRRQKSKSFPPAAPPKCCAKPASPPKISANTPAFPK